MRFTRRTISSFWRNGQEVITVFLNRILPPKSTRASRRLAIWVSHGGYSNMCQTWFRNSISYFLRGLGNAVLALFGNFLVIYRMSSKIVRWTQYSGSQGSVEQITRSNFTFRNLRTDIQVHANRTFLMGGFRYNIAQNTDRKKKPLEFRISQ